MWNHAATRRNLATVQADGAEIILPATGELACGEVGEGRMADVADIVARIMTRLGNG